MTTTVHAAPLVLTMTGEPLRDGAVLVEGDTVADVGPRSEVVRRAGAARVRDWSGMLLPGLVNGHAHLEYGPSFNDLATSGMPFVKWIKALSRRRAPMTDADWGIDARGSVHELLRSGTTAVADVVTRGPGISVAGKAGLQGISFVELAGVDAQGWPEALVRLEQLLAVPGRPLGVSPHAVYSLGSQVFRDMAGLARTRGMRLHPHLAETADEAEWVLSGTGTLHRATSRLGFAFELAGVGSGRTPVQHCDELGGLGPDVHVAHGVHVDAGDRALLRERGTAVALCTRSNAVLQAGEAPVASYLAEGSPVALGTDSLASCADLDLLAEARATRDLAVRQGLDHPERLLVEAATVGGAKAMGIEAGTVVVGGRADLAVFDVPTAGDPWETLVEHGAGRCVATVLGGRLVHRR